MSKKIFSGKNSQKFWDAVNKSKSEILFEYGCKAQELEQQRDELRTACKGLSTVCQKIGLTDDQNMRDKLAQAVVKAEAALAKS